MSSAYMIIPASVSCVMLVIRSLIYKMNYSGPSIINLVVCRLNVYVGKERMLVFFVVISVVMTQKAVATVVRGNRAPNQQSSPCLQAHKL